MVADSRPQQCKKLATICASLTRVLGGSTARFMPLMLKRGFPQQVKGSVTNKGVDMVEIFLSPILIPPFYSRYESNTFYKTFIQTQEAKRRRYSILLQKSNRISSP